MLDATLGELDVTAVLVEVVVHAGREPPHQPRQPRRRAGATDDPAMTSGMRASSISSESASSTSAKPRGPWTAPLMSVASMSRR